MWLRQIAQLSTTMSARTRKRGQNHIRSRGINGARPGSEREEGWMYIVHLLTPGPERDGVPLLDLEALALLAPGAGAGGGGSGGGHGHGDVALVHRERTYDANPRRAGDREGGTASRGRRELSRLVRTKPTKKRGRATCNPPYGPS